MSNQEGELKKRIKQTRKNFKTPVNMPCYIDDEMWLAWMDEARAEFPKVEHITRVTLDPPGEFSFFIYDTNKIDAWLKKWFGE